MFKQKSLKSVLCRCAYRLLNDSRFFSVGRSLLSYLLFFITRTRARARIAGDKKRTLAQLLLIVIVALGMGINIALPQRTSAAVNNTINFQARLEDSSGAIVPDGTYNLEFKLYNVSSGGTALWTEDYLNSASQGAQVINGYLSVSLGSITAFPTSISWDQPLYLTM